MMQWNVRSIAQRPVSALCLLTLFFLGQAVLEAAKPGSDQYLGMNFRWNNYSEPVYYFNNALLQTNRWLNTTPSNLPTDADGWPTSLNGSSGVGIPLFLDNGNHYPTGTWVLEWEGEGELQLQKISGNPTVALVDSGPNRREYRIPDNSTNGFKVVWVSTAAAPNHVRNARLWLPGGEAAKTLLHPLVIADHAGVKVVRLMDLSRTNGNPEVRWSDRNLPGSPVQRPLAWEYMVGIANDLDADLWLCVPHRANDDYVRSLARLVRDNLEDSLRVWVEYSNEIWNGNFSQTSWVDRNIPGANLEVKYVSRSTEIFDLFKDEFDGLERIVRVIATQTIDPSRAEARLEAAGGNADVLAITSYYGQDEDAYIRANWPITKADFADYLLNRDNNRPVNTVLKERWKANADLAREHGVTLVAYEGKSHLVTNGGLTSDQQTFLEEFHHSEENAAVYRQVLDYLASVGMITHAGYCNYDIPQPRWWWGHRNYSGQPLSEAHMWRELSEWAQAWSTKPRVSATSVNSGSETVRIEWVDGENVPVVLESSGDFSTWDSLEEATATGNPVTKDIDLPTTGPLFLRLRREAGN